MYDWVDHAIAVTATFLSLSWIIFMLRCWTRAHLVNLLGWDDLLMLLSIIMFTVFATAFIVLIGSALIPPGFEGEGTRLANLLLTAGVFFIGTVMCVKLSICISFLHFVTSRLQRNIIYAVMTVCALDNLAHFFTLIFMCGRPSRYFENYTKDKCVSKSIQTALLYEQTIMDLVTNGVLTILASIIVYKKHLPLTRLLPVAGALSVGWLATIAPIVRLSRINQSTAVTVFVIPDPGTITNWVIIECGALLISGCLMALGPLFQHGTLHDNTAKPPTVIASQRSSGTSGTSGTSGSCRSKCSGDKNPPPPPLPDQALKQMEAIALKKQDTVPFSKTTVNHGWNPRAWENDDPRRRAKTTTTCVGGRSVVGTAPPPPPPPMPLPLRQAAGHSLSPPPHAHHPNSHALVHDHMDRILPWRPSHTRNISESDTISSGGVMKTMVVDLETSDEEEEDKDEDADRFTVTSSGAIAKGTRPVSQISLNLPVIWPFREHSEERERKKDSHDLSSLKGKARSDEGSSLFIPELADSAAMSTDTRRFTFYSEASFEQV